MEKRDIDGMDSSMEKEVFLLHQIGENAKNAEVILRNLESEKKNQALLLAADTLTEQAGFLLEENDKDIRQAKENGMPEGLVDRLLLTEERIRAMAEGLRQIAGLEDPIGEVFRWELWESFMNPAPM